MVRGLLDEGSVMEVRRCETGVARRLFAGRRREDSWGEEGVEEEKGRSFGMVMLEQRRWHILDDRHLQQLGEDGVVEVNLRNVVNNRFVRLLNCGRYPRT